MQKTKLTIFLTVLSLTLFGMAGVASAAEYYVSPTGVAVWANCGGATPLNGASACSVQTAMSNAVADDVVYFRGGNYYPPSVGADKTYPAWYPVNSGSNGHPVMMIAYPEEIPIIYQHSDGSGAIGARYGWVVWDGFILVKQATLGANGVFKVDSANNITIRNTEIVGNEAGDSQNQVGIYVDNTTNMYIYNNKIHSFTGASSVNTGAMWLFGDSDAFVYNNSIYDNVHGIQTKGSHTHITAYNNFFYNNSRSAIHHNQQAIGVSQFYYHNNVAILPANGFFMKANDPSATYTDTQLYNNTIYCQGSCYGVYITNSYTQGLTAWNNIIYGFIGTTEFFRTITGNGIVDYLDYNNYYTAGTANWRRDSSVYTTITSWRTATSLDTNSVTTNPNFINAGGTTPADYKRTSYPTDGRGGSYASIMGAYINGDEIIGYVAPTVTDTTPPSAPTGLAVE